MNTITGLTKVWLSELTTRGCSNNTIELYKRNMEEFSRFVSKEEKKIGILAENISRDHIILALSDYRGRKDKRTNKIVNRSTQSVMSYYTTLKSFLNWCDQSEKITTNPMKNVKRPKVANRVPKALSMQDCQLLIDSSSKTNNPERDTLLYKLGLTMGLRLSEISNIKLSDFSPSSIAPEQLNVIGKGDKERVIPVPESVKKSLVSYLAARDIMLKGVEHDHLFLSSRTGLVSNLTADGIGQVFDAVLKLAGIKQPGLRVHMTRHSFATHMLNSNSSDLIGVKELLGHSSVATTQIYLKVDPLKLAKSINDNPLNALK